MKAQSRRKGTAAPILTSMEDVDGWSTPCSGNFTHKKWPRYALGPGPVSMGVDKLKPLAPSGFEPRIL